MKADTKLLIVGVDAADGHLIEQWALEGALPAFSRLMKQSVWGDSKNPTGMVSGTVWPTFYTGVMPGRTGRFRGTTQFSSGTYQHADIDPEGYAHPTSWDVLGDAVPPTDVITLLQKTQFNPELIRAYAQRKRQQNLLVWVPATSALVRASEDVEPNRPEQCPMNQWLVQ